MDYVISVSQVLTLSTRFFEIIRFYPERIDLVEFFGDMEKFYEQDIKRWNFLQFKTLFSANHPFENEESYNVIVKTCYLHRDPTDNIEGIAFYQPVLIALVKHGKYLASQGKLEQLKDFIDTIHCLADALWQKDVWHSRDFWNHRIKKYCKRWNVQFPGMRKYFFRFFIFNRR